MKKIIIVIIALFNLIVFTVFFEITIISDKSDTSVKESEASILGDNDWIRFNTLAANTISAYDNIVDMSRGLNHTLFITADGIVYSTGYNYFGQLGNGKSFYNGDYAGTPSDAREDNIVKVSDGAEQNGFVNDGTDPVIAVAAGGYHSLILTRSGVVYGFGAGGYGRLGIGEDVNSITIPRKVIDTENFSNNNIKAIATGHHHSLILKNDGTVYAFGHNASEKLAVGDNTSGILTPTKVVNGTIFENGSITDPVIAIESGMDYNVLLTENGAVYSFGINTFGQLGDGTNVNRNTPVKMVGAQSIAGISAIGEHTVVITSSGTAYAVGRNNFGQLGIGKKVSEYTTDQNNDGNVNTDDAFEKNLVKIQDNADFINNGTIKTVKAGRYHTLF